MFCQFEKPTGKGLVSLFRKIIAPKLGGKSKDFSEQVFFFISNLNSFTIFALLDQVFSFMVYVLNDNILSLLTEMFLNFHNIAQCHYYSLFIYRSGRSRDLYYLGVGGG